uniref:Uncharacterized protein n=1 Tax=Anguilla anguilla TaxID=7936 RepID=A0A0E9QHA8_ANGAN
MCRLSYLLHMQCSQIFNCMMLYITHGSFMNFYGCSIVASA